MSGGSNSDGLPGVTRGLLANNVNMRSPYSVRRSSSSALGFTHSRKPINDLGNDTSKRDKNPWSLKRESFNSCSATPGWSIKCIDNRLPKYVISPSPARTLSSSPVSQIWDKPAAVASFFSSVMAWPPTNWPPSFANKPSDGWATPNNLTSPSNVGSLHVKTGRRGSNGKLCFSCCRSLDFRALSSTWLPRPLSRGLFLIRSLSYSYIS